jgi:hypothetical protein
VYQTYVYKITNKITNQFYFGSRFQNVSKQRHPEEDLWKYYFTSSKRVKELIEEYGLDSFDIEIVFRSDDYKKSFWEEQRLILEHKNNPLRLNKAYIDPTTGTKMNTTFLETEEDKLARFQSISKAKKGKFNSNGHFGLKRSEETKQKQREAQARINYRHSDETKEKMRGRTRSDEHSKKLSESLKGKPWSEARRLAQLNRKGKNDGTKAV